MMEKLAVVVVHGIGAGQGRDRQEFSLSLKRNVEKRLPSDANLVWEEANWEVLNDAIDLVIEYVIKNNCERYAKKTEDALGRLEKKPNLWCESKYRLIKFLGKCISKIKAMMLKSKTKGLAAMEKYIPDIIDAAIDLPLYMQSPKQEQIRKVVRDAIKRAKGNADKVILVGHSLGSVIAFDVAAEELNENGSGNLAALVTMGSPLKWVTEIRAAESNGKDVVPRIKSIPWINFWDLADPVPEQEELDTKIFLGVDNREVKSRLDLVAAHCSYWNNAEIAETIADMIKGDVIVH
jgi:hypothetical protein